LAESAGKEDTVELDCSLAQFKKRNTCFDMHRHKYINIIQ
jgi:hypothetical protein